MKIKSIMLAVGMAAILPLTAAANKDHSEDLIKSLKLDDNRAQQVERIMDDYEDQHELLKKQKKDRLDEVLTDDEMDRLEAMKKAKKNKYKNRD
jgi:Spy/CpxP family protein refolding chaperone